MPIRVTSKRLGGTPARSDEVVIRCDRSNPVLGNPYILKNHRNAAERQRVIAQYAHDLEEDFRLQGPKYLACVSIARLVGNGGSVALSCYCAPLPCHADLLLVKIKAILTLPNAHP